MTTKRLLGIFAHPDDESTIGGTLLQCHANGIETGLVYATRGELGEISDPALATPDNLAQVREQEMRNAAAVLGVSELWFLDYRDSGMAGRPENQDPRSFVCARAAEVVGKLVAIIRQFRPQVLVTFDEMGGYGHPDHIAIYKYTTSAFHAAADKFLYPELGPAHSVSKLYYTAFAHRHIVMMDEWLQTQEEESNIFRGTNLDLLGLPDEQISVTLDVEPWQAEKTRALQKHRTQGNSFSAILRMPTELQRKLRNSEYFQLAASRVGPDIIGENDLFARIPG